MIAVAVVFGDLSGHMARQCKADKVEVHNLAKSSIRRDVYITSQLLNSDHARLGAT